MAAEVIAWISEQIETRPELMVCRTDDDVRTAKREGKLGIFYRLQGPSPIGLDLDLVWFYKQAGVDLMQIAYNTRNPFGIQPFGNICTFLVVRKYSVSTPRADNNGLSCSNSF